MKPAHWSILFAVAAASTAFFAVRDAVDGDRISAVLLSALAVLMADGARRGIAGFRFGLFTAVFVLLWIAAALSAMADGDWGLAALCAVLGLVAASLWLAPTLGRRG